MAITNQELKNFTEYIPEEDLKVTLSIDIYNHINSSIVWYKESKPKHNLNINTQIVYSWNEIDLNYPLDLFLKQMKEWEHEYCTSMNGLHSYTYFDYAIKQWNKKLKQWDEKLKEEKL
jgi:hypothetical protein